MRHDSVNSQKRHSTYAQVIVIILGLKIHRVDLYTESTYTQSRLIHRVDLYTESTYTQSRLIRRVDL